MNDEVCASNFFADYSGLTGDKRLDMRANALWNQLSISPSSNISSLSSNRAEQVAYYRLLENQKLTEAGLIKELVSRTAPLVEGRDILCLEDSSEINVSSNKNRLQPNTGLGRSDNSGNSTCFKIHPGLVLDANTSNPLGFSAIKLYHRPIEMSDRYQRKYKRLPIQEKESFKWIEVSQSSKEILKLADRVTYVQDREGDIFEQFALIPDQNNHLLVRSRTSRKLSDGCDLYTKLNQRPLAGIYSIDIDCDKRNKSKKEKRTAIMEVRYGSFSIQCPDNLKSKGYPKSIDVDCVYIKEVTPGVINIIEWRLLTTHQINSYQDAIKMIEWYRTRWHIEQVFRLLKHKGFGIENTQLETGWAIRKLVLMQLSALLKIMQMNIAYNQPEGGQPIEEVFTNQQIEVLRAMNKKLQGQTLLTQNQNNPKEMKWATWVVGRLGGWKGYDSQGPPGVICLKNGLIRLHHIIEGINLAKDMCTG